MARRAGFRRSAPAKPEPAEPATNHRQPQQATCRLGEDREEEQQAGDAQEQGRDGPFEHGVEPDAVHVDQAVDRTEPTEADCEAAVAIRWSAATRPRATAGSGAAAGSRAAGLGRRLAAGSRRRRGVARSSGAGRP